MTTKNSYWIVSPMGEYALVEGTAERDRWTRVLDWRVADEPPATAQVHIVHPDGLRGRIPYEAVKGQWSGLGWTAGPPPEPVDITKDPRLVDQVVEPSGQPALVEAPAKPKTPAAAGGEKIKEA